MCQTYFVVWKVCHLKANMFLFLTVIEVGSNLALETLASADLKLNAIHGYSLF